MRRLACSLEVDSVYAVPPQIKNSKETASALAEILNLDRDMIIKRLNKPKMFVWLKRKVSDEEVEAIASLKIKGVDFVKENKRFYPNGSLASHILGIVDIDNRGLEGVELFYDKYLKGEPGWKEVVKDAKERELVSERCCSYSR